MRRLKAAAMPTLELSRLSFSEADCTEYQESAALLLTGTFHVQNGVKQCH